MKKPKTHDQLSCDGNIILRANSPCKNPLFNFFWVESHMTNGAVFVPWTLLCDIFIFCPKPWNISNYISPSVCSHNPPYITITTIPLAPAALNKEEEEK